MALSDGAMYGVSCAVYVGLAGIWLLFTFLYPKFADRCLGTRQEVFRSYGEEI